jgi:2-dehydropantoate 2-reductase
MQMRFLVIGAGAIGGSAGAYLAHDGHDVLLVDADVAHVRRMQEAGLRMEGRRDFTVRIKAALPGEMAAALGHQPPETVIFAVKSQHTEAALAPLLPLLGPDSVVLSMQNGLNPHAIAGQVGVGRTLAALVNSMGTDYLEPGRILYGGPGTMRIGELDGRMTLRIAQLAGLMRTSFVDDATPTDNVWGYLWGKEGWGAMLFAGAVMDQTIADMLADPANRPLLANIAGEVVRVADAEGVHCEPFDGYDPAVMRFSVPRDWAAIGDSLAALERRYRPSLKQKSGIWRDLVVRRRPTEVDAQLGIVAEFAGRRGIAVPLIERVVAIIHEIERGERALDTANMAELRTLDSRTYGDGG